MPKFLEKKLKKQYPGNPGAVYGTMNKLGFMHGNKETAKGKKAEKKHMKDMHMGHHEDMHGSSMHSITGSKEKMPGKKKKTNKKKMFMKNIMAGARY